MQVISYCEEKLFSVLFSFDDDFRRVVKPQNLKALFTQNDGAIKTSGKSVAFFQWLQTAEAKDVHPEGLKYVSDTLLSKKALIRH